MWRNDLITHRYTWTDSFNDTPKGRVDSSGFLKNRFNKSRLTTALIAFWSKDEIILSTDKGSIMRCAVKEIRTAGRNTQGVRIIKLTGEEKVVSAIKIDDNLI